MKVTFSVVLFLAALAATYCYPADKKDDAKSKGAPDKDVDIVPLGPASPFPQGGVIDIDADSDGFFGNPFAGNAFPSLLSSIEALMGRMRQQLSQILGRLPEKPGDVPFSELHIPNLGDIDLGKGNSTSVTKIIDGHKVVINETEYKQDSNDGAAFFKVRIIDVHPESEEVSTEKDAEAVSPVKRDRESLEDTINNEIPKSKDNEELNFDNIETFDEVDIVPPHKYANKHKTEWDNIRSVESIEDNSIDSAPRQVIHDLSNDIYVNELLQNSGVAPNPDAEVFEVINGQIPPKFYPPAKPEKIVPFNYIPARQESMPAYLPVNEFERASISQEPMPIFNSLPLPYYAPPAMPLNSERYDFPIIIQSNDPIVTHASSPILNAQQYIPVEQQQQTSPANKVQTKQADVKPINNVPGAPQHGAPMTSNQAPSSST